MQLLCLGVHCVGNRDHRVCVDKEARRHVIKLRVFCYQRQRECSAIRGRLEAELINKNRSKAQLPTNQHNELHVALIHQLATRLQLEHNTNRILVIVSFTRAEFVLMDSDFAIDGPGA